MMKKIIAAASLLLATVAVPAFAQGPFYAGATLGDDYAGVLGGYQIDKMFSVEAHYNKFDSVSVGIGSGDATNYGVTGVATFPMKLNNVPPFSLFATLGIERTTAKVKVDVFGSTYSASASETDLVLGGGAQYDFNQHLSARLGIKTDGPGDSLYISALYKF